jgi:2-polyprenyl-3-methyl-5-hydroxy-6-metoxy-1,4-benzoquinol methylase
VEAERTVTVNLLARPGLRDRYPRLDRRRAMSIFHFIGQWFVPPAFHSKARRWLSSRAPKDLNETVNPNQLRHVRRYEFARAHIEGKVVLDAACGAGYGSDLLEPLEKYVGIDYADYCIKYADEHFGATHRQFLEADIYSLSELFAAGSFDTIVSLETLEHLEDPRKALEIFLNLVRSSGRLIISVPLNHPDRVYHKRRYTHADVRNLVQDVVKDGVADVDEYLQEHLAITPLSRLLRADATGAWLGILTKRAGNGRASR